MSLIGCFIFAESVDPTDLRWKLQKKGSQQGYQSGKASVVRDLRDKLSGAMQSQPPNIDPSKAKRVSEISGTIKKSLRHDPPKPEAKKPTDSTVGNPSKRKVYILFFFAVTTHKLQCRSNFMVCYF